MLLRRKGRQDSHCQMPAGPVEILWYLAQQECLLQMQLSDYRDISEKNGLILGSPVDQSINS